MDYLIRACRPADVEAVLRLWKDAGATPSATDTAEALHLALETGSAAILVAETQGRLIGSIIAGFDGWRGNLYRLAVHPESRRRRIAQKLVAAAEEHLREVGAVRVTALVEMLHPDAVGFWEAAGYQPDPRIRRYVRMLG